MSADFTGTFQRVYTVRLDETEDVPSEWIPGAQWPVKLLLALRDQIDLKPALADPESAGAILVLRMRWEEMRKIYSAITALAERMDLPLPTKNERQI